MSKLPIGFRIFRGDVEVDAVRFERSIIKVGKVPSAHLRLDDPSVSRFHCIIDTDPQPSIIDLGSFTRTHVNGESVSRAVLRNGDRIGIGVFTLVVELARDAVTELPPLTVTPDHSQPIVLPIAPPGDPVSLDALGDGLPAPRSAAVQLHVVPERKPDPQVATLLGMLDGKAKAFVELAKDREDLDELMGTMLVVAIDKLREKRTDPEIGELYSQGIECLGELESARAAPSLLVELLQGLPKGSDKPSWRKHVCTMIAGHAACWPYLERVADLPGFAIAAARAAVRAGRDPMPWLSHPYWKVRLEAAQAFGDDTKRASALASVWTSFARSNVPVEGNLRDARAAAKRTGIAIDPLPDLPALVTGLQSPCADFRAWTIGAIDRRRERSELVELGIADVLEAARARAGWSRTLIDWEAWRRVVPGLPANPEARWAWLFAYACERGELAGGAVALLAGDPPAFEPPHLALDGDAREAILDNERCELLAALGHLEDMARELEALSDHEKTPVLPDA